MSTSQNKICHATYCDYFMEQPLINCLKERLRHICPLWSGIGIKCSSQLHCNSFVPMRGSFLRKSTLQSHYWEQRNHVRLPRAFWSSTVNLMENGNIAFIIVAINYEHYENIMKETNLSFARYFLFLFFFKERDASATATCLFNTLSPRQNGRHFPEDIFKCIFMNENV